MKVFINKRLVNLTNNEWLTSGGEGDIYSFPAKYNSMYNSQVIKIYHDYKKAISSTKITELKTLKSSDSPFVIHPIHRVLNDTQKLIGFTMQEVKDAFALCQFYTTTFWNKNNITINTIINIIEELRKGFEFVHKHNCLIVDANDFNFLIDKKDYKNLFFIDADSYKTPNFPPTAITDSIRDWTNPKFTIYTDWFSFSILVCQLLVGIHPFKGTHDGFSKGDIKSRTLARKSIFNKNTKVPFSTRNFDLIPNSYRNWFEKLFENGERLLPPDIIESISITLQSAVNYISTHGNIEVKEFYKSDEIILGYFLCDNKEIIKTKSKFIQSSKKLDNNNEKIIFKFGVPIGVSLSDNKLCLREMDTNKIIPTNIFANSIMIIDNTSIIIYKNKISNIKFAKISNSIIATSGMNGGNIIKYADILSGFIHQNILGKAHLSLFNIKNDNLCTYTKAIKELDGYKVINGKYINYVCSIIGYKNGIYDHFLIQFTKNDFSNYIISKIEDITYSDANLAVLDKGVILYIVDNIMYVTSKYNNNKIIKIQENFINNQMKLCSIKDKVFFIDGNTIYSISMK